MTRILTRRYEEKDRAAVLAIFDSNLPEYFGAGDREWLEETLDEPDGPAFVVDVDGVPGAFGGYEIWEHYDKALLFWGMAARAYHGAGLGKLLLFERLLHVATSAEPPTRYVTVDTSPEVSPFFQHCGFELTSVWPGGYRSGMDMHELRFDLAGISLAELEARRGAALARCATFSTPTVAGDRSQPPMVGQP
ncbi:GNAT family N-acetyltransferase [Sphingomonas sp. LB2R24]|uniref:GNAT family N-acetyltransferase n=1 Tax=Sphingomonas sorbitolis TaxID=3096165 RepID=UPI002FCA2FB7